MEVEDLQDFQMPETDDKIKVTLTGSYEQFKAIKKTKKYKTLLRKGVRVVFRPKKLIVKEEVQNTDTQTSFKTILRDLILSKRDPYLTQSYELIINKKNSNVDDIIFL